jgi:uncharacterized protein YjbJ (UPF0337 family)
MDEFRKKSVDEQVGGQGKIEERLGKLSGDRELKSEGQAEQGEGKVREGMGKAGRAISDLTNRAKDKLNCRD